MLNEANTTSDLKLKRQPLESAARLARERGDLRQAVDLLASEDDDRSGFAEGYSARDEFLDKVVQDAVKAKDVEVLTLEVAGEFLDLDQRAAAFP